MKTIIVLIVAISLIVACSEPPGSPKYEMERKWYSTPLDETQSLENIKRLEDCTYISMSRERYPYDLYVVRCPGSKTTTATMRPQGKRRIEDSVTVESE